MGGTIAITGATGFVGQAVLDVAEREGLSLRALARKVPDDRESVSWVQGSLADTDALLQLVDRADAVIHIAGLTNTPDPAEFEVANVDGTANVIAACKTAKVKRLIFVSSLAAREPGLSAYGASKAVAEELVKASGLDWTIVRPPGVYGPRDVDYLEMFRTAKLGFVPLPPGGASSIVHVDDLARLLMILVTRTLRPATRSISGQHPSERAEGAGGLAVRASEVHKQVFEPDDGRQGGWGHKELAKAIGKAMGRRVYAPSLPRPVLEVAATVDRLVRGDAAKLTPDRVGYMCHPNWVSRFDKRVPESIWTPEISGEEGLRQTAEWYRAKGWL